MLDKDGKYEIHLTPELVGYISEMMSEEKEKIKGDDLEPLILPLIEEWKKAEEKYCGYDTSEFVEKITQGKFN